MSRRNQIIIIAIAVLVLIAVFLVFWLISEENVPPINSNQNSAPTNQRISSLNAANLNINIAPPQVTKQPNTQSVLTALAQVFAEKYGSFSSEGNFENLKDLKFIATARLAASFDSYMPSNPLPQNDFYGVTTKAINTEIITMNSEETEAQVMVGTQRSETKGAGNPRVYYQNIILKVLKIDNYWKVDQADWQ